MKENIEKIQQRIVAAAKKCGRDPNSIQLIAVSKTVSADILKTAIRSGLCTFGENYIQEAREKISTLSPFEKECKPEINIKWHFIGHLQSKKAKYATCLFDWIHSVDSLKLARELNKSAKKQKKVQNILIQVNIAEEKSKSGIIEKDLFNLIQDISALNNLSIKGLMTLPPYYNNPQKARPFFARLAELRIKIEHLHIDRVSMKELSMGMTGDFEVAIEEGATFVRIGTAIFGERH